MNFFDRQAASRRLSRQLIFLFVLAVIAVVVAVNAVVLLLLAGSGRHRYDDELMAGSWLAVNSGAVFWTTLCVLAVIGLASLYKSSALSGGGGVVARSLGGVRIDADTRDLEKKRLLNVVEEMAIASGVPVPEVYVLEQETGINAFAAGHNPSNAAIAVTRGALQTLNRAELQGVIAHEFSHILNGDMRLSVRLMGLLFGLLVIALVARLVLRLAPRDRRNNAGAAIFIAAMAIMAIGYVGLFFGRLIQAAVSRSRESLADASAVQFTRDPLGLRGALVKIGANETGSNLAAPQTDEVAHMLFAAGMQRLFATHPALIERIQALDPTFRSSEFDVVRAQLLSAPVQTEAPEQGAPDKLGSLLKTAIAVTPAAVSGLVGNPDTPHVQLAQEMRESLPDFVQDFASQTSSARALFFALALDFDHDARERQVLFIEHQLGAALGAEIKAALVSIDKLDFAQRLPALLRLFPTLRQLPRTQRQQMLACLNALLQREGQINVHAYAIRKLAQVYLQDELSPQQRSANLTITAVVDELQILFSVLARDGHEDQTSARRAYELGLSRLLPNQHPAYGVTGNWWTSMDLALTRLDRLMPAGKEQLVEALVATIAYDGKVSIAEAELLRMICATLHCPLPPLLGAEPGPTALAQPG